jgi:hypothetical protein
MEDQVMDALAVLYSALHSPIGVLVQAEPDFDRARAAMYKARHESGDERLRVLTIGAAGEGFAGAGNMTVFKSRRPTAAPSPLRDLPEAL